MPQQALLFLNGQPPTRFRKNLLQYQIIACTDGAYSSYLTQTPIDIDYIIGDLDSLQKKPEKNKPMIIHAPDQNKTDFEKTLLFLIDKGITHVDIYGATGYACDHFLGNLSVALRYYKRIILSFYDDYSHFFFADTQTHLHNVKGQIISIMPFISAINVTLRGFTYPLKNATLKFGSLTSLRNKAEDNDVSIHFESGDLLVFINHRELISD